MSIRDDMKCFYYTFVCFECHTDWWHYCFPRSINSRICTLDSALVWWCCQLRHMISEGKHRHVIPVCSHLIKSRTNVYAEQNQMKYFAFWSLIEYFIISPRSHDSDVAKMNSSRIILLKIGIKTPKVHWRNFNFNKIFSLDSSTEGMNESEFMNLFFL